jgi:hypothetical protein
MLHFVVEVSVVIVYDFAAAVSTAVSRAVAVYGFLRISPLVNVEWCGS